MVRLRLPAAALVAAAGASSASSPTSSRSSVGPGDLVLHTRDVLALPYSTSVNSPSLLVRRQGPGPQPGPAVQLNANNAVNLTDWDRETTAACISALRDLPRSTNPSGNCLCYNLPSLDTATGVFEADLRLYRISEARDGFAGVGPSDINVGIQYSGASVSPISSNELMAMGFVSNRTQVAAPGAGSPNSLAPRAESREPQLLQTYMFVGQIDKAQMRNNMSMAALEAILMPTLTLTARNTRGGAVSTNVSLNEASFLTGVFSKQVVLSDFSAAQAAVDAKVAGLLNGTVAFVLPGVQLMVFPIGLVITSIWLLLGVAAYGFGTYERVMHVDMYKRRTAVAMGAMSGGRKTF